MQCWCQRHFGNPESSCFSQRSVLRTSMRPSHLSLKGHGLFGFGACSCCSLMLRKVCCSCYSCFSMFGPWSMFERSFRVPSCSRCTTAYRDDSLPDLLTACGVAGLRGSSVVRCIWLSPMCIKRQPAPVHPLDCLPLAPKSDTLKYRNVS